MRMIGLARTRAAVAGIGIAAVSVTAAASVSFPASAQALIWSVVPSPSPAPTFNELDSVSCLSATACTAVGNHAVTSGVAGPRTLIESWNGTSWSLVPSPSPGPEINELAGASCVSAAACTAAGTDGGTGYSRTLIESGSASG